LTSVVVVVVVVVAVVVDPRKYVHECLCTIKLRTQISIAKADKSKKVILSNPRSKYEVYLKGAVLN
jgi:hypothetical protein